MWILIDVCAYIVAKKLNWWSMLRSIIDFSIKTIKLKKLATQRFLLVTLNLNCEFIYTLSSKYFHRPLGARLQELKKNRIRAQYSKDSRHQNVNTYSNNNWMFLIYINREFPKSTDRISSLLRRDTNDVYAKDYSCAISSLLVCWMSKYSWNIFFLGSIQFWFKLRLMRAKLVFILLL